MVNQVVRQKPIVIANDFVLLYRVDQIDLVSQLKCLLYVSFWSTMCDTCCILLTN